MFGMMEGALVGGAFGAVAGNVVYADTNASFFEKTAAGAGAGALIGAGIGGALSCATPTGKSACAGMALGGVAGIIENTAKEKHEPLSDLGTIARDAAIGTGLGAAVGAGVSALSSSPAVPAIGNEVNKILSFTGRGVDEILRDIKATEAKIAQLLDEASCGHEVTSRLISAKNHLKVLKNELARAGH